MADHDQPVGVGGGKVLTAKEQEAANIHADEILWFKENAYGINKVRLPERLVPKLIAVAKESGVSFRREILKASAWAMTHPEKKNYGRFYAGWIGRAKPQSGGKITNWEDPI